MLEIVILAKLYGGAFVNINLGQALMLEIKNTDFSEIIASGTDIAVSQLVEDSPLKEIPIFGTILKLCKAGLDVKNYLFAKNVYAFLYEPSKIPYDKRISFVESLENKGMLTKVGENVVLLIERVDDMDKANIIGKLFAKWIEGKTDQDTFFRLAHVVIRSYIADLKLLAKNSNNPALHQWLNPIQEEALYNLGLLSIKLVGTTQVSPIHGLSGEGTPRFKYYVSDLAMDLVALGFG